MNSNIVLGGAGISVKEGDLAQILSSNVVSVSVSVGRNRGVIPLPTKQFGLDPKNLGEKGQGFYSDHMDAGCLRLIPREYEKRLGTVEMRIRNGIKKMEICDGFIPIVAYNSVKSLYEKVTDEYFDIREEILDNWDDILEDFRLGCEELLDGVEMPSDLRKMFLRQILAQAPTKSSFAGSFYMTLNVTNYPALAIPEGIESSIAADISSSWKSGVVETALKSIEAACGKCFSALGMALTAMMQNRPIPSKTLNNIERLSSDLHWKNIFQNEYLSRCSRQLERIVKEEDPDERCNRIEEAMYDLWSYCQPAGIKLDYSCVPPVYSKEHFENEQKIRAACDAMNKKLGVA